MDKIVINIHSMVDVITNSSTELFVGGIKKDKETIESILEEIMKEVGCTAVEFDISPAYDEETDEESDNVFEIWYDYEMHHEPCGLLERRIKEVFGVKND
jgi:hypothetical protein